MFARIKEFYRSVYSEFMKVHWPGRDAVLMSTFVVLSVSLVLAVYLGISDVGLSNAVKYLISV